MLAKLFGNCQGGGAPAPGASPRRSPRSRRSAVRGASGAFLLAWLLPALGMIAPPSAAASREAADAISAEFLGKRATLLVALRQPTPGGHAAPAFDERGWHYVDPDQPVLLHAGEAVEISGVFNYGDQGIFLEIARKQIFQGRAPRLRVRFSAGAGPDATPMQIAQIRSLILRVLRPEP